MSSTGTTESSTSVQPSILLAMIPVVALIGLLAVNVLTYGDSATSGPNQIALIFAAAIAAMVGWSLSVPFKSMLDGIVDSLGSALGAILILLMIGALSGTWMLSGVVPAMVYYGLAILEPSYFLVAATIICAVVSVATGSSWSTVATVGVALIGIGTALGASPPMTAGAIISGAYFGDKLSPLSDTTNLASAMAGTDLIVHIRYMLWTTVPSLLIALGVFYYLGTSLDASAANSEDVAALSELIASRFVISPWLFLVPATVVGLVLFKVDALVALFVGTMLGGVVAIYVQPDIVREISSFDFGERLEGWPIWLANTVEYAADAYIALINSMSGINDGIDLSQSLTEVEQVAKGEGREAIMELTAKQRANVYASDLLGSKGMAGMLNTIWLIVCAMCFGGVMEACGLLKRITDVLVSFAKSTGSLIATTAGSCLFLNFTASDQYLAIVVPGRMFRETYRERGLAPENLSRTLEDSGTVTSPLIPWNTCGAVQAGVLGVGTLQYLQYCVFNYVSPFMTILVGFAGLGIVMLATGTSSSQEEKETD
ncbi:MAG: Na+/H+ antiporter NhaC family protein [Planctomycetota bacterium]